MTELMVKAKDGQPVEVDKPWRLVCHACGYGYDVNTDIAVSKVDCCAAPDLHFHGLRSPCELCSPIDSRCACNPRLTEYPLGRHLPYCPTRANRRENTAV